MRRRSARGGQASAPLTETICRIYQKREWGRYRLETLSGIIDQEQLYRIDLLKIDTEGAEHEILAGIQSEHWPRIKQAIVEVHDGLPGLKSVVDLLEAHGFRTTHEKLLPTLDHLYVVYATRQCDSVS